MARKRSRARGWALQVMYAWESRGVRDRLPDMLRSFIAERNVSREAQEYLETLITTVDMYLEPIDARITESLLNWRLERLSIIDRNILRIAAAEMLHLAIPPRVVIQEALQLGEKYSTNESPRFINGVLDALMRKAQLDGARQGRCKLKLLVVNWQDRLNPHSGGAEIHLHEIFGRLADRGHEITLLVSSWTGAESRVQLDGMDVHRTGGRHTFPLAAPTYYRRHLASQSFDVVIEDLNKVPVFAPVWSRAPVVLLVHHLFGMTAFEEANAAMASLTWLLERPLSAFYGRIPVQSVSESTALDLVGRGFDRNRIAVIPNGVDLSFFTPDPAATRFDEPTALYLGRLKRYKRVDLIIRAMAKLKQDGTPGRLVVGGQGDARPELERLCAELEVTDRVDIAGFVTEERKRELFRRAWVHVLASPKEGWGISNMEAAACGTATVASNSPGLRDSVRDGETGFLVPHGDVSALAARIQDILGNRELRDRLGAQARRFAEGFSWDQSADLTESHLQEV